MDEKPGFLGVNGARNFRETLDGEIKAIKAAWNNLRIGDGHLAGMLRLGGHELTQALAAFPDSNIRPMDEPGVFGNATPQIVTEQMGHQDYEHSLSQFAARGGQEPERGLTR